MAKYNHLIEDWWRHQGCYDREQASGIPYKVEQSYYLEVTDAWWDFLTDEEKAAVYENFFNEE